MKHRLILPYLLITIGIGFILLGAFCWLLVTIDMIKDLNIEQVNCSFVGLFAMAIGWGHGIAGVKWRDKEYKTLTISR